MGKVGRVVSAEGFAGVTMTTTNTTLVVQRLLDRMRTGEGAARGELIERAIERLRRIATKELRRFPKVKDQQETDDVLNTTMFRFLRAAFVRYATR